MGEHSKGKVFSSSFHKNMLQEVVGSDIATDHLLHSYKRSFNGFVVKLTEEEVHKMARMDGVVSVFPNEKKQLHTTRSWDFLGFPTQVKRSTTVESDTVIAVLDTGIWPESDSFKDSGFGPPPKKWKGTCHQVNLTCNNKIIGARYYRTDGLFDEVDTKSARDSEGHGTHTASTIVGGLVERASLMGLGSGTARGGVPSARIAVYKVCWADGCHDADILAAFDDAIADGVDIISLSLGGSTAKDYFNDSIAIGTFHAMRNGILTSASAGNDGPSSATISNFSPWMLSVAASTIDRKFFTNIQLGNNKIYQGISLNTFDLKNQMFPIIYGGNAPNVTGGFNASESRFCLEHSVDKNLVQGKIVLCDSFVVPKETTPLVRAGAVGLIMQGTRRRDVANSYPLPSSYLDMDDGGDVYLYINTNNNSTATIFKTHEGNDSLAPCVASFSSRGPNPITLDILKPDLSAPGVDILAAWTPISSVTRAEGDNRFVKYNIISGTSMACPHVTAVAAYIKSFHPTWSPAAIKSALMTTATPMHALSNSDAEFAYGAGHLDPLQSLNPGLIYDADEVDYVKFLCGQGYDTRLLRIVTGDSSSCSEVNYGTIWDLNYPSFALASSPSEYISRVFRRTVTNVGSAMSIYQVKVDAPLGLNIDVIPSVLSFTALGQNQSFAVTIQGTIDESIVSASLVWDDGTYQVRSPIVVYVV
nr:cucumisin-like [Ziziphus jujuba var. spinosa]